MNLFNSHRINSDFKINKIYNYNDKSLYKSRNNIANTNFDTIFPLNHTSRNIRKNNNLLSIKNNSMKSMNIIQNTKLELSPFLSEREKLTIYYETIFKNKRSENKIISLRDKKLKKELFCKYHIKNKSYGFVDNKSFKMNKSECSINIIKPYFKSIDKANNILNINKEIKNRLDDITNYFAIEKLKKKIKDIDNIKRLKKKMPRVIIKLKNEENLNKDPFANMKKLNQKHTIKKINNDNLTERYNKFQARNSNCITMKLFRRISCNIMLSANTIRNQKLNEKDKHQVIILISYLDPYYKPPARSEFSSNILNNNVYIFGGNSSIQYNNDIYSFNLINKKWEKIKINKENKPLPRCGHTSAIIENNIVIYGGESPMINNRLNENVLIFNTINNNFIYPKIKNHNIIGQRKGHICISISQTIFIYGGEDIFNLKTLNNAFTLNCSNLTWDSLNINSNLPYLKYHSGVLVNDFNIYTNNPYNIYTYPRDLPSNRNRKIKVEGIYIFGGINENNEYNSDLYIIKINRNPCNLFVANIDGIPPLPRINCKMLFIEDYNFIIIHGGMDRNQNILNEIMILDVESLNWIKPILDINNSEKGIYDLIPRTDHEMFYHNGKIYIFGGRQERRFLNLKFECLQFEVTNF